MISQGDRDQEEIKPAQAAVAIVLAPLEQGESVLIIRRASHPQDPWSGHLAFPGGKIEETDASPLMAAIRETHEECGVRLREAECIEQGPLVEAGHYSGRVLRVRTFAFFLDREPVLIPDPTEVESVFWLPVSEFLDHGKHHAHPFHPKLKEKNFPHMHVEGSRLWGFTYEQFQNFLVRRGDLSKRVILEP